MKTKPFLVYEILQFSIQAVMGFLLNVMHLINCVSLKHDLYNFLSVKINIRFRFSIIKQRFTLFTDTELSIPALTNFEKSLRQDREYSSRSKLCTQNSAYSAELLELGNFQ